MDPRVILALGLVGAFVCWCALAAPELPALARAAGHRARELLRLDAVRVDLAQAELRFLSPGAWVAVRWGLAAVTGVLGHLVFGLPVVALVVALATYHLLGTALESRRRQVEAARQRALLDAIRYGSSVISRAGSAFQMLEALAGGGPIAAQPIFRQLVAGARADETARLVGAVLRMRDRLADPLFDDLALALLLHWKQGGRLAPALDFLAADWSETLRLHREAKVLRAGIEATVLVLTIMPFVFLLLIHWLAPALLAPLGEPVGEAVLASAVGWMVIGYRVLQRMTQPPREDRIAFNEDAL